MINPAIIDLIKESSSIGILSHISPDGDSLGSSLALYNGLKNSDKDVKIIVDDDIPSTYHFLKSWERIERPIKDYDFDVVIVLDSGNVERVGNSDKYLKGSSVINIDHHPSNTNFGQYNIVDSEAAATAEIIYCFLQKLGIEIDKHISECLYTGIVTDTGKFQYSNTTSTTHYIAGNLMKYDINPSKITSLIYQNNSKEKLKLKGEAINNIEFFYDDKISCITITQEVTNRIGAKDDDFDGVVNIARDVSTVEVAIFLREEENGRVKVSLRSKEYIDVNYIAGKFGGGGHKRASGATIQGDIYTLKNDLVEETIKLFQEIER